MCGRGVEDVGDQGRTVVPCSLRGIPETDDVGSGVSDYNGSKKDLFHEIRLVSDSADQVRENVDGNAHSERGESE